MKIAVFAYSRQGCRTARKVCACFPEAEQKVHTMERFAGDGFLPLGRPSKPFYGELFDWADAMIFVGSCGIAVREIAAHVRDKRTDPAVLCIDELGNFVIPLLSGHIGGANDLARLLAEHLDATPVITTATDINQKFSVDAWAVKQELVIDSMPLAKAVSAAILENSVPLCSDLPIGTAYPPGVVPGDSGELGICISWERKEPFFRTLRLIPAVLHLGIGCRRGTEAEAISTAVEQVLNAKNIDRRAIKCVSSIDLKAGEAGLLTFCEENRWPVSFYSAEALRAVEGEFTSSGFVQSITGVDNVCERAALLGANRMIVRKTAMNGVTVAIAAENREVRFG